MGRYRSAAGFVLLSAIWGSAFPAIKAGLAVLPPVLFAAFRFDLTALLVLGYAAVAGVRLRPKGRDWHAIVAAGGLIIALHHVLLFVGQDAVSSAVAAVLVSTIPILSATFARTLLPGATLDAVGVAGLLLGLLGAAVIADPEPGALLTPDAVGAGIVLVSAAVWALGTVLIERTRTDLPVESLQAWAMAVGAPLLHLTSVALGEPQAVPSTTTAVLALGYLVTVAGGLGYLLYFGLLDRIGSLEINLLHYTTPVFAALGGWLLLGEAIEPSTAVGFAVITAGFALVKRRAIRAELRRSIA